MIDFPQNLLKGSMKKSQLQFLMFGSLLACLAVVLQFFEYRYMIGNLETSVYTSVIAILFTGLGIWLGYNLLKSSKSEKAQIIEVQIDHEMLKKLNLNEREYQVLELIAKGYSNQQMADQLFLALPTIKTHLSNLYTKMNVQSRTQAVHKARKLKLIAF